MAASRTRLLLPALRRWPQPLPADLARALGRADRRDHVEAQALGFSADIPASAALSRLGEGDLDADAVRAYRWLRADPAWIRPEINGARLFAVGAMLPTDPTDRQAFGPAIQSLLDEAGFVLDMPHPQRWYLRMPHNTELPRFATPVDALGTDVFDHRPQGDAARRWRVLDNEVQVTLHQHPHNRERQAAGLPPINALWWWGDAPLPDGIAAEIPSLHSDDPVLRGLARLLNMACTPLAAQWSAGAQGLHDLRAVRADRLYADWLQPALRDIAKGRDMHWICEEGPAFSLTPRHRWRVWRTPIKIAKPDHAA